MGDRARMQVRFRFSVSFVRPARVLGFFAGSSLEVGSVHDTRNAKVA